MRIVGFNFTKISAEKFETTAKTKPKISMGIDVSSLDKQKISAINQDVFKTEFTFNIKYEKLANFDIKGFVFFTTDPKMVKDIQKKWKDKKIPDAIRIPLFNFILTKCNLRVLSFEEEFNLPTHIPFPRIEKQQSKPYV